MFAELIFSSPSQKCFSHRRGRASVVTNCFACFLIVVIEEVEQFLTEFKSLYNLEKVGKNERS